MRQRTELELDSKGLDNFFRFGYIFTPRLDRENKDVEDGEEEPILPEGYKIWTP